MELSMSLRISASSRLPSALGLLFILALVAIIPIGASAQLDVDAGDDVTLECSDPGGAEYTLNGSVSGSDDYSFAWSTDPDVTLDEADTLTPTGTFPIGETIVTLEAQATGGELESDEATITVEDSHPPVVRARAEPSILWPPNHSMREIDVRIRLRDRCSEDDDDLEVELVSVESNEPDNGRGDGNTTDDIQNASIGEDDRQVSLRAERAGPGNGRVYTLTYRVTDGSGNETEAEARVYVPKSFADVRDRLENGDPGDPDDICVRPDVAAEAFVDAIPQISDYPSYSTCVRACRVWNKGCAGIVKGTARCVRSEQKSLYALGLVECREADEPRQCRNDAKDEASDARDELELETEAGEETCARVGRRCANACADYHDPDGSDFDDEGLGED
jgi:hypothetical protein